MTTPYKLLCLVGVDLYYIASWVLTQTLDNKIEVLEMYVYRLMLGDHVTNVKIVNNLL